MLISISRFGININYKCYRLYSIFEERCQDARSDKCFTCRYCKAELSANDATRLLTSFGKRITDIRKEAEESNGSK